MRTKPQGLYHRVFTSEAFAVYHSHHEVLLLLQLLGFWEAFVVSLANKPWVALWEDLVNEVKIRHLLLESAHSEWLSGVSKTHTHTHTHTHTYALSLVLLPLRLCVCVCIGVRGWLVITPFCLIADSLRGPLLFTWVNRGAECNWRQRHVRMYRYRGCTLSVVQSIKSCMYVCIINEVCVCACVRVCARFSGIFIKDKC